MQKNINESLRPLKELHNIPPSLVVRTLETTPIELAREGIPTSNLSDKHYRDSLALLAEGKIAKEGLVDLLRIMACHPEMSASEAAQSVGLMSMEESDVESIIHNIVCAKSDLVRSKGERSIGPFMGLVMKELRGKADGALVSAILKKEIKNILDQ